MVWPWSCVLCTSSGCLMSRFAFMYFEITVNHTVERNLSTFWNIRHFPTFSFRLHGNVNGQPLQTGHRFQTTRDFGFISLNILYMHPEVSGVYTVVGRNEVGEAFSQGKIQLLNPSCNVNSTTSCGSSGDPLWIHRWSTSCHCVDNYRKGLTTGFYLVKMLLRLRSVQRLCTLRCLLLSEINPKSLVVWNLRPVSSVWSLTDHSTWEKK